MDQGKAWFGKMKFFKFTKYALIGVITGMANGLFGSGGGTIVVPSMVFLLKAEEHKAHATAIAIILPLTVVSAFMYIRGDFINWPLTLNVMLGGITGGYIGARLLNKCPAGLLSKMFGSFMILAALRMILWK